MKVGDYVRFKTLSREIKIGKVIEIIEPDKESMKKYCVYDLDNNEATVDDYIIKSSPNIIDLIEVGDIITNQQGEIIVPTGGNIDELKDTWKIFKNIKSIVTKECFESMEYKI